MVDNPERINATGEQLAMLRFAFLLMCLWLPSLSLAADRAALVIGNTDYAELPAPALAASDAETVASVLRDLGYDVTLVQNAERAQLIRAFRTFDQNQRDSNARIVFYAGHSAAVNGQTYLLPIDSAPDAKDVQFAGVALRTALSGVSASLTGANLVMLDLYDAFAQATGDELPELPAQTAMLSYTSPGDAASLNTTNAVEQSNSPLVRELMVRLWQADVTFEQLGRSVARSLKSDAPSAHLVSFRSSISRDIALSDHVEAPKPAQEPQITFRTQIRGLSIKPRQPAETSIEPSSERGWVFTGKKDQPSFPWPPPQPSGTVLLPMDVVGDRSSAKSIGDVMTYLEGALNQKGYHDRSYWSVPGGAALATRLERINKAGEALEAPTRWPTSKLEADFSLASYLKSLFYTEPGLFRVIVFVLSTEAIVTSDRNATSDEALDWLRRGMITLPAEIARKSIDPAHRLTALIYEFEKVEGSEAIVLSPGRLTGRDHLRSAGLLSALSPN